MPLFRRLVALGLVASALPLLSMLAAAGIANVLGCRLHEGNPNPCVLAGVDIGSTLYGMAVSAWLMLVTLPIAALLLVSWALIEIVCRLRNRSDKPA